MRDRCVKAVGAKGERLDKVKEEPQPKLVVIKGQSSDYNSRDAPATGAKRCHNTTVLWSLRK